MTSAEMKTAARLLRVDFDFDLDLREVIPDAAERQAMMRRCWDSQGQPQDFTGPADVVYAAPLAWFLADELEQAAPYQLTATEQAQIDNPVPLAPAGNRSER